MSLPEGIDWGFISSEEGGQHLQGYVPCHGGNHVGNTPVDDHLVGRIIGRRGVTVATGFDLGQRNESELRRMKLSAGLIDRVRPYLGRIKREAVVVLNARPLTITRLEADALDVAAKVQIFTRVSSRYDEAIKNAGAGLTFPKLPTPIRTAIVSFAFQYGPNFGAAAAADSPVRAYFSLLVKQEWEDAALLLLSFGTFQNRRRREAALLRQGVLVLDKERAVLQQVKVPVHPVQRGSQPHVLVWSAPERSVQGRQCVADSSAARGYLRGFLQDFEGRTMLRRAVLARGLVARATMRTLPDAQVLELAAALVSRSRLAIVPLTRPERRPTRLRPVEKQLAPASPQPRGPSRTPPPTPLKTKLAQAIALEIAARTGVPFCEECAKAGAAAASPVPAKLPPRGPAPPARSQASPTPSQDTKCKHEGLTVKCGHGSRKFSLQLPGSQSQFDVISDGEVISCTTSMVKGPCGSHGNGSAFEVTGTAAKIRKRTTAACEFGVDGPATAFSSRPWTFFWPQNVAPVEYGVRLATCEGSSHSARVRVYPDISWTVSVPMFGGTTIEKEWEARNTSRQKVIKDAQRSGGGIAISVLANGTKHELSAEFSEKIEKSLKFYDALKTIFSTTSRMLGQMGAASLEISFPKIGIEGTWGWEEVEGKPTCEYRGSVGLVAQPLIGISGTLDVTEVLLQLWPGVGTIIAQVKKRLKTHLDLGVRATGSGMLDGSVKASKPAGGKWEPEGSIDGKVRLGLEGFARASGHAWIFEVKAEGRIGGEAGIDGSLKLGIDDAGAYLEGSVVFSGLEVYAIVSIEGPVEYEYDVRHVLVQGSAPLERKCHFIKNQ